MTIKRTLVANRGEIAVRVIRAAHALGIEAVQVVSAADRDSEAARMADQVVVIGPAPSKQSYLNAGLIVHAAKQTGCDALHPGYGFLSERAELANLCAENGITFVGPAAETIGALGDKLRSRAIAAEAGVPLVPGTDKIASITAAHKAAEKLGYPVLMKASAGGGGRGMFVARNADAITASFDAASTEAEEAFGDGTLYMETYVENARHVEVQAVGDGKGRVVHFGERDCSVQRRYQKVIEEAPCALMPAKLRGELHESAVKLLSSMKYLNAGTVEFLYDVDRQAIYFIEVNTRIQVEHPVSEQVTGFDLVQTQFRIAGGEAALPRQDQIKVGRHAIECRINAEDAARNFMPSPGRITRWSPPRGAGIRVDSHCHDGYLVPPYYDSMIAKLIVTADDRPACVERLQRALANFEVEGLTTNIPLLRYIVAQNDFAQNRFHTKWLEQSVLPAFQQDHV
ncbi:MAG: acetyl-CoA carboxylase biotin carboxylase subunit [Gammaproteobacteria bacterium]|nr:acetyl-CoA carboxylase biotin carboxylase subunit [Gammaproteobacteria bacterium]